MNREVRQLFHELADLPEAERCRILDERGIAPELRTELESLLLFDTGEDAFAGRVSSVAESALRDVETFQSGSCGPYRLVRLLGSGGMGAVYLGERNDGELQQKVAIKLLRAGADRPQWRDRFLRERQLLAWLNHPAIARLLDAGRLPGGQPYLVMEYVEGEAIDNWCAGKDVREVLGLFVRVCDGVAHAHRHLIIHRDLKPSNILVDAGGQPKLLDFGIAKLLDKAADDTRTVERMLTPSYASPEQIGGGAQTTATDVYSLGAVLHKLLKGWTPREPEAGAATAGAIAKDLECILRKALRENPAERYASAEALANDVRRYLQWRPVEARSGDGWYRVQRFLRRYWLPLSTTAVTTAGLSFGIYTANRERAIAERRFVQVRQLANKVLSLDDQIGALPGATKVRHEIVAMSGEYLEALRSDAHGDSSLGLEIGQAFIRLAHTQGVPTASNLGQYAAAAESLRKAEALVEPAAAASPRDRAPLLASAQIAHDRMILENSDRQFDEALAHGRKSAARVEALLQLSPTTVELHSAAQMLLNVALAHKNQHHYPEAIAYAGRSLEVQALSKPDPWFRSGAFSIIADSRRLSGDVTGALEAVRQSRAAVDSAAKDDTYPHLSNLFGTLWREGVILGEAGMINLGRTDEAIATLQKAFDLAENSAQMDSNDSSSRVHVANAAWKLGQILAPTDPRRALAIYDHGLSRLREVKNNATARRQEANLLAVSSYPLRQFGRAAEANARIETALRLLAEVKTYPAARIDPGSETDSVLRAQADFMSAAGQNSRALELYGGLLDKIMASNPDPQHDLRHATTLSDLYAAMMHQYRQARRNAEADALAARRLAIWSAWARRLPRSPYVARQLESAKVK